MNRSLPTRRLRENPDLDQLKRQGKELLAAFRAGEEAAVAEVNTHYTAADPGSFALHDALLVIARAYGHESWPKLKAFVDGATVQRLADFVRADDLAKVDSMLDARPELVNMDMAENNEHRAIHYAVFHRSVPMVRLLMRRGADARKGIYPHRAATTALAIAEQRGYEEIVAAIHDEERRRRPAALPLADELIGALLGGEEDRALLILEANPALVKSCSREGWTPLHAAAARRSQHAVAWLLNHGTDANQRGPKDYTPLDAACRFADAGAFPPIANLLLAHGGVMTPRAAVALGDDDWIRARHSEGMLENPIEDWGGLLTIAVQHDQPKMLELLLDLGFDPDERTRLEGIEEVFYTQSMPLWNCAKLGKLEMGELLLQRGASTNKHVYASGSPVYSAYSNQQWAMLDLLKRYGGIVDPVTIGLFKERDLAHQILIDEAAGRVPPEILEDRNVSEDLLRGGADSGDVEIVRMALPGVDWPAGDDRWYWILMQAIWSGSTECMALLVERSGGHLRHPRFGRTVLHDVAALGGAETAAAAPRLAEILLDAGARLDERDDILKSTPLGWACRWGRTDLVRYLLHRGANPNEPTAEPWARPRAWAERMGHSEILALLNSALG